LPSFHKNTGVVTCDQLNSIDRFSRSLFQQQKEKKYYETYISTPPQTQKIRTWIQKAYAIS
jgi:hypothetical protein